MTMSEEQKKAASERMKAYQAAKKLLKDNTPPTDVQAEVPSPEEIGTLPSESRSTEDELRAQVAELKDLFIQTLRGQTNQGSPAISVGNGGKLIGEVEKYTVDPTNYMDPTKRLSEEPRLQAMAFNLNYELEYEMSVRPYETKTGVNQKEPEFLITLLRVVLDDQGLPTEKRYIARRMVFHEDPQAAIVIARENGISLEEFTDLDNTTENQKLFLNEMRYLRAKEWLFDIFWPRPAKKQDGLHEEVIGGTIVQVFTKSSEEPSGVDFDQIKTVMR